MRSIATCVVVALLFVGGCREPDAPVAPGVAGTVVVDSDPQGARILVNSDDTGLVTPDTLHDLIVGEDTISVVSEVDGRQYGFRLPVRSASSEEVVEVKAPLLLQCAGSDCFEATLDHHEPNDVRLATSALGMLLFTAGEGMGLHWPAASENSYAAIGSAVIAGVREGVGDTVALGPYNLGHMVGRPAPTVEMADGRYTLEQTMWVLPPGVPGGGTLRGIEIEQTLIGDAAVDGVVLLRLVFRNISGEPLYQAFDGGVDSGGETLESVHIGFALDADIGRATIEANDDRISYVPDRDLAFIYDGDFATSEFTEGWDVRPGLAGIRMLEAPDGAAVLLNGWPGSADWEADTETEASGLAWLSATQSTPSNHPHERIGYAPAEADDYRVLVSAGDLRLAPGDSAAITVALLLAPPVEGEFTSGNVFEPGDPTDPDRPLADVLAELIDRADAAESLLPLDGG